MCRLHTDGTKHGCGHYIITRKKLREDCGSPYCIHSVRHQENCPHCPNCTRYFDPDASETITMTTPDYCPECEYWFRGAGARHH